MAICNELHKPVCDHHAQYCVEEGHGTSPLEEDELCGYPFQGFAGVTCTLKKGHPGKDHMGNL